MCEQSLDAAKDKQELLESVADFVHSKFLNEALDDCIFEVFQVTLLTMSSLFH